MNRYDAIVVGARCAGAPTAMLLARAGQRVLLLDRDGFPSDTVSTHFVHAPGVAALRRWGLLDQLVASGCPRVTEYSYDFGPFTVSGSPLPTQDGVAVAHGPRRTVLDALLVEAAAEAGADVREHVSVDELVMDGDRVVGVRGRDTRAGHGVVAERADLVVGADGRHSVVARAVGVPEHRSHPPLSVGYYAYWSDLPVGRLDMHLRPERAVMAFDTNDGLACLVVAAPHREVRELSRDLEAGYLAGVRLVPELADRLGSARRESRIVGMGVPGFWRQPWGPGWALVGDARCDRDPCTAQGITSAFLDAEALAAARIAVRNGTATDVAMTAFQEARESQSLPLDELTRDLGTLEPPPPERAALLAAVAGDAEASQRFVSMIAGTLPVPDFFAGAAHAAGLGAAPGSAGSPAG